MDVILGGHPHVVQPAGMREVTLADGTEHEALVAFSLGNFNSGMADEYADAGVDPRIHARRTGRGRLFHRGHWLRAHLLLAERTASLPPFPPFAYYDEAPEGMSAEEHQRLRKSVDDVTALMGGRLAVLEK